MQASGALGGPLLQYPSLEGPGNGLGLSEVDPELSIAPRRRKGASRIEERGPNHDQPAGCRVGMEAEGPKANLCSRVAHSG